METVNLIINAISSLGFPIVMCCLLFWKMDKQDKDHKEEMEKHDKVNAEATQKVTEAVNNNTIALQKLIDKLSM